MKDPVEDLCVLLITCGHHTQSQADLALAHYRKVKARAQDVGSRDSGIGGCQTP